jgi:Fe-S-cluster containining protein
MNRTAGTFGTWLGQMRQVLRGEQDADVPCDGCVGCCVSSYPVPLRPADQVALARVPERYLQLPASGGVARMLHRPDGTCPLLDANCCTIYADRPQTCRDYDCRIYAAAGLVPDGRRPVIEQRVLEWRFGFEDEAARANAAAVLQAAAFIRAHADRFPAGMRAHSATAAAVLAVKVYPVFLEHGEAAQIPAADRVLAIVAAARAFDAGTG